jgi:hypothetical protein
VSLNSKVIRVKPIRKTVQIGINPDMTPIDKTRTNPIRKPFNPNLKPKNNGGTNIKRKRTT